MVVVGVGSGVGTAGLHPTLYAIGASRIITITATVFITA